MSSAPIQIVDEDDRPVGQATKQEAWQQGLLHRIVRIMLEDDKGNILLQHRDPSKDIFPNRWDNSVAGHVDADEDYDTAAYREMWEELSLDGIPLEVVGTYRSDETWHEHRFNRFTKVYRARIAVTPEKLEAGKIDGVRWFTPQAVQQLVQDHPDEVSDGLRQVVERYY
jgi:16S rRNA (adenine1518-N6/adenine1519-N6)-dimethyltransferase